jgi:hypothetical protein
MRIVIGTLQIELLEPSPDLDDIPQGQAETYQLFMELAHEAETAFGSQTILERLGLKSALPLVSRLEHLRERGLVRLKKCLMAAT